MPHLLIRGIAPNRMQEIGRSLIAELAGLCRCPEDHILLECQHTTAVFGDEPVPSFPFITVSWFDRGAEVRDRAADCIDRHVRSLGIPELELAFVVYERESYYANGKSMAVDSAEAVLTARLAALEAENGRLKDELARTRKALLTNLNGGQGASATMSSKLRDALRE